MSDNKAKKYFLRTLVAALSVSALIGIYVFLAGDFGETEIKLLLTTFTIGGFSLTGLCSATIINREKLSNFSYSGIGVSVLGFITTIIVIWSEVDFDDLGLWQLMLILIILSVAIAHISLLLQINPKTSLIKFMLIGTILSISIVGLMLIYSTLTLFSEVFFYWQILGVVSILDVLGTIATPILNKATDKD